MAFIIYDIILLVIFAIFVSYFLYTRRKNVKKEGLLLLYRTKWGMELIDKIGGKYKNTLYYLSYVSIGMGYVLMAGMIYLFFRIIYIYIALPAVVREIKVPPIMPLVPYLPQVFQIDFLPPFYFIYWVVILAVIAIPHEFAHGIFMKRFGIKIKSTGFGFFPFFLPIFLAAFVEQDEKSMEKSTRFHQMATLSAGTFANIITAIIVFVILWGFFAVAFTPSGVMFDTYSYSVIDSSEIETVNGMPIDEVSYDGILEALNGTGINTIEAGGEEYLLTEELFGEPGRRTLFEERDSVVLYDDAPAIRNELFGAITEIGGKEVKSREDLSNILSSYSPGDEIIVTTETPEETKSNEITLGENPNDSEEPWLGIGFLERGGSGIMGTVFSAATSFRESGVYYEPTFGEFSVFIYNLLWWLILILISVALVNMLPVGIFDGGRFFYLTILSLTKSEKVAKSAFAGVTYLFLLVLLVIMIFWGLSF